MSSTGAFALTMATTPGTGCPLSYRCGVSDALPSTRTRAHAAANLSIRNGPFRKVPQLSYLERPRQVHLVAVPRGVFVPEPELIDATSGTSFSETDSHNDLELTWGITCGG